MTDTILTEVRSKNDKYLNSGLNNLQSLIEVKLAQFRGISVYSNGNPLDVIHFYSEINDILVQKCFASDSISFIFYGHKHLPIPSTPYALFLKGMAKRFSEIAFGIIYIG